MLVGLNNNLRIGTYLCMSFGWSSMMLCFSGVSVIFGGRYVMKWKEDGITWGNCSLFYEEIVQVVEQRKIGDKTLSIRRFN